MTSNQHFSLRWNNYLRHVINVFDDLRNKEDLVDVTLCCEGKKIKAHKMLLSACSSYFREIFKENPCQHPVIIFRNVRYDDLLCIINFMYHGEVNILQERLASFLTTADLLEVQGLTDDSENKSQDDAVKDIGFVKESEFLGPQEPLNIAQTRKRKSEENEEDLWAFEKPDCTNTLDLKLENIEIRDNLNERDKPNDKADIQIVVPLESVEAPSQDTLQSACHTLEELKSSDTSQLLTNENVQNLTSNESLKDVTQGFFNWKVVPLETADIESENIFTPKMGTSPKTLMFDTKIVKINKNRSQVGQLSCDLCDKVFKHPLSLSHHKKIHRQNIICKICSKTFSRSYNLLRHMKSSHSSV